MEQLVAETVPAEIMMENPLAMGGGRPEMEVLVSMRTARMTHSDTPYTMCCLWPAGGAVFTVPVLFLSG